MRIMSGIVIAVCGVAAYLAAASAAIAGPAVATELKASKLAFEACKDRAAAVLQEAGFGRIERAGRSVFGTKGDYTGSIRCVTERGLVFFVVAGPSRTEAGQSNNTLSSHF